MGCYLIWAGLALYYISLMNDVEHLFMSLLAICMSSLKKNLFIFFVQFLIGFFVFLLLNCESLIFLDINPDQICNLQIFSTVP